MLFEGSHPRVLSVIRVLRGLHCASLGCWIPPWSLKSESTSPAVAYACRWNYASILHIKHLYRTMPSESTHPDMTPVVWNVPNIANHWNQQKCGPLGNAQVPPAKRRISVPGCKRDSARGGSSIASMIPGQNITPSSSQNNSCVADITQSVTSAPSATLRWSLNTPTITLGTSSCRTPAPRGTTQTESTCCVVSSPTSSIAGTPTALSGLEILPTPIPNPQAHAMITNSVRTRSIERNHRHRQWQLQPQVVSTPRSVFSGSCSIHWFGQLDITRLVFATGRLLELYMQNRWPCISRSDLEMVSYGTWRVVKALVEALPRQIIETYMNTTMQQNKIWSIEVQGSTKEIPKEVCWSNSPRWILHAQSGTRFMYKSKRLNPILFN